MKEIKTKFGTIYKDDKSCHLLDSDKNVLVFCIDEQERKEVIEDLQSKETIGQWLEQFSGTCWSKKKDDCRQFAIDCVDNHYYWTDEKKQEEIDIINECWESHLNRLGDYYILWDYDNID